MVKPLGLGRGSSGAKTALLRRSAGALLGVLILFFAFHVLPARSEPTLEEQIAEATRLLESGRVDKAQSIVSRLRAAPNPGLQVLFLSGALYAMKGRYRDAAEEFRLMLARDPTLVRPRLELARALFLAREYNAARYHFEQVLASPLPDMVRANVLTYLTLIRERVPSFAFSFDIVADSNPKQATSTQIVEIGGLLYQLNQSALSQRTFARV